MLIENTRVRAKIQVAFEPLAVPHVAKVRYDYVHVLSECASLLFLQGCGSLSECLWVTLQSSSYTKVHYHP